jgi:hypothetical protein
MSTQSNCQKAKEHARSAMGKFMKACGVQAFGMGLDKRCMRMERCKLSIWTIPTCLPDCPALVDAKQVTLQIFRYIGDYKNGQKDGQGSCTYPNGSVHSGLYCNGVKSGLGTCTWANGNDFSGMYVNDRMHGTGRFQWASGHVYTGEFASDRRHGRGMLIFKNGRRQKGHWNKGDFVAESDWGAVDVGTTEWW